MFQFTLPTCLWTWGHILLPTCVLHFCSMLIFQMSCNFELNRLCCWKYRQFLPPVQELQKLPSPTMIFYADKLCLVSIQWRNQLCAVAFHLRILVCVVPSVPQEWRVICTVCDYRVFRKVLHNSLTREVANSMEQNFHELEKLKYGITFPILMENGTCSYHV